MFENLSEKLQRAFKTLRGAGHPQRREHPGGAARDPPGAARSRRQLQGRQAAHRPHPGQGRRAGSGDRALAGEQVIKIVRDELVEILGQDTAKLKFASQPPTVVLMAGLQGSGKTTTSGKLANWLKNGGHRPLLVSVDVYRPAAREQLEGGRRRRSRPTSTKAKSAKPTPPRSSAWRKKRAARPSTPAATC